VNPGTLRRLIENLSISISKSLISGEGHVWFVRRDGSLSFVDALRMPRREAQSQMTYREYTSHRDIN